jgi:hypothetical protein
MCGGSGASNFRHEEIDIGLNLKLVKMYYKNDTNALEPLGHVIDDLRRRQTWCWQDPYKRQITEEDLNDSNLTLEVNRADGRLVSNVRQLLADRREYITRKIQKEETKKTQIIQKQDSCSII